LEGGSEVENCTPFLYDLSDRVPDRFKDAKRGVMFVDSSRVRQDRRVITSSCGARAKTSTLCRPTPMSGDVEAERAMAGVAILGRRALIVATMVCAPARRSARASVGNSRRMLTAACDR
jgi:hypothetical protein